MMGLFSRVKRLFYASANDLVDKMGNEEKILKFALRKMEDEIAKAQDGLVAMIVNQKQIVKERDRVANQIPAMNIKIKNSISNKDDALILIANKQNYEAIVEQYNKSIAQQETSIAKMKIDIQKAHAKVKQMECTKNVLLARKVVAETRGVIFHDLVLDDKVTAEMERKIEHKETYADVWEELSAQSSAVDDEGVLAEYEMLRGLSGDNDLQVM